MTVAHLLSDLALDGRAPMPVDVPPVGPARARRLRILQLRERLMASGNAVDTNAVAEAIARRALFAGQLREQLVDETRGALV